MIEVSIKVSNDESSLTSKYLVHTEGMMLCHEDPELLRMVEETKAKFKDECKDILIKIKYTW
jgi:hypothetical protein